MKTLGAIFPCIALGAAFLTSSAVHAHGPEQIDGHAIGACEGGPVIMVVAGQTLDREKMLAYGQAIAESGLYNQLGGYYLNVPRAIATFEGKPAAGYTVLMVRFPCLANAQAFWYSKVYQEEILPLRLTPSAGNYTVTVYPEADVPAYITDGSAWPGKSAAKPDREPAASLPIAHD